VRLRLLMQTSRDRLMLAERIDLVLSRLKQGFDSPRERQKFQRLRFELEKSSNIRRISVDERW
jgi:hypothetical protein